MLTVRRCAGPTGQRKLRDAGIDRPAGGHVSRGALPDGGSVQLRHAFGAARGGSFRSARIIRRTCRIARRLASVRLFVYRCDITNRFVAKSISSFAHYDLSEAERSLLEALATHLAAAMENLRTGSAGAQTAVAQEQKFPRARAARFIAQSPAFLKMQVQLLRDAQASGDAELIAQVVGEIDEGVRELQRCTRTAAAFPHACQ